MDAALRILFRQAAASGPDPDPEPEPAVFTISAEAISSSVIRYSWSAPEIPEGAVDVEFFTSPAGSYLGEAAVPATTFDLTGLAPLTHVAAYAVATAAFEALATSNTVEATSQAEEPVGAPSPPTEAVATIVSRTAIALGWTDNATDETGYRIYRSVNGGSFSVAANIAANSVSYNDIGLAQGSQYDYRIHAVNGSGESAYAAAGVPELGPLNAPTNLRVDGDVTETSAPQTWDHSETEPAGVASGFQQFLDADLYAGAALTEGTSYAFRVRAIHAGLGQVSPLSGVLNVTTKPAAPTGLGGEAFGVIPDGDGFIRLTWTRNTAGDFPTAIARWDPGTSAVVEVFDFAYGSTYDLPSDIALSSYPAYWVVYEEGTPPSGPSNALDAWLVAE